MATLYDHRGLPVSTKQLTQTLAAPDILSTRQAWFNSVANGLTPERLGGILAAVDMNNALEYLTLAEEMEERDLHYASVLHTRKLAVAGLEIVVESPTDKRNDVKVADFVREVLTYDAVSNLRMEQMDALGKGYSVSEIMWDRSGAQWVPSCYEWRDPRFFQFDYATGQELRLRDKQDPANGIPLAPFKFIQHRPRIKTGLPIRGGLARLVAVAYMCKSYGLKDWLAFAEVFGMPIRVGKYPSASNPDEKAALLRAVANIGTDAAAIIPDTMVIEFVNGAGATGGDKLFEGLADWLDRQVSKGVLGQTMTTDDGASLSQAKVHNDVRADIKIADADQLAATLRRDLVKPLVDLNYGPRAERLYPRVRLMLEEPEDLESLGKSLSVFIDRGLPVEVSTILDKFGLEMPEDGAMLLQPASAASFPQTQELVTQDAAKPDVAPAPPPDMTPQQYASEHRKLHLALMRKALAGDELTTDQRRMLALAASSPADDVIDVMANDALADWQPAMDPILEPIAKLARESANAEEFQRKLDKLKIDPEIFMRAVATLTFKARGLGAATDKTTKR